MDGLGAVLARIVYYLLVGCGIVAMSICVHNARAASSETIKGDEPYVVVIESYIGDQLLGRLVGFGTMSKQDCEAKLVGLLKNEPEDVHYKGLCIPQRLLEQYLHAQHQESMRDPDVWTR